MPQSNILVTAALRMDREGELRSLLESMNHRPGSVNPANSVVPFEQFAQLHFARLVILEDRTAGDLTAAYGVPQVNYPLCLAFVADFDGTADEFRADLARRAKDGLERIFSCCQGFEPRMNLAEWMKEHENASATNYINWVGRTVGQIREEDALRLALENHVQANSANFADNTAREVHAALREFVHAETNSGRLSFNPAPPTPFGWWLRNAAHLIFVPLVLLLISPFLLLYLPFFCYQLRSREQSDPVIAPRVGQADEQKLASLEDYDVTNQFTAMGSLKPGLFRRWTLVFLLWVLDWTTRHVYTRGQLARVPTIHFARWVFLNDRRRLLFASNYDSSLETYMDDFINKVGWGLNLVFSNGVGYPASRWLILDGAKDEQKFKNFLRRHELPTEVWYKAYPGLSAFDLKRNTLIRQGIERSAMSDSECREWLSLL